MQVKLTLEMAPENAVKLLQYLQDDLPSDETEEKETPKKRTRRTKVEMAAARETEAEEEGEEETEVKRHRKQQDKDEGEDRSSRRRKRRGKEEIPSRKKTRRKAREEEVEADLDNKIPFDDDSISDADVVKAASDGAEAHTVKVISALLEEFGVDNVHNLDQEQRQEFIDLIAEMDADND